MRPASILVAASMLVPMPGVEEKAAVVTVLAESGAPLRDLKAADFVVKESGRKLPVTAVDVAPPMTSIPFPVLPETTS